MDDVARREFTVLRETIRDRGTVRPLAFLLGFAVWAAALTSVLVWLPTPLASVVPLLVLLATFETVRSLHLGVERIGRYIQVFFEERHDGHAPPAPPLWEHTAMAFGPALPGAGVHPLFLTALMMAAFANFLAVLLPRPAPVEITTLAVPHLAFLFWMIRCDRAMRLQRASDLSRFREIRNTQATTPASTQ